MTRLVVYGLLRRGESMAGFLAGSRFLGEARIAGYDLYHLGGFPGAVPGGAGIVGELYELGDPGLLDLLDEAEGVAEDPPLYRREQVEALDGPAWMYVYARDPGPARIATGDWLSR